MLAHSDRRWEWHLDDLAPSAHMHTAQPAPTVRAVRDVMRYDLRWLRLASPGSIVLRRPLLARRLGRRPFGHVGLREGWRGLLRLQALYRRFQLRDALQRRAQLRLQVRDLLAQLGVLGQYGSVRFIGDHAPSVPERSSLNSYLMIRIVSPCSVWATIKSRPESDLPIVMYRSSLTE